MSDLPYIDSTLETKIAGQDATGNNINFVGADSNGNMFTVVNNASGASAVNIQDGGNSITVDGTVAATQSGTWNINNVSGTVSLPTGASTSALQTTGNTSLSSIVTNTNSLNLAQASTTSGQTGNLVMGAVTTAAPTYTTAQTDPLSLTTAGALRTDSSATTQPISGTVTANQGGTWNINNVSGTVSLPTGAATSANQSTEITSLQLLDDVPAGMNAAFSKGNPVMGQLDDTSTTVATEDNVAPVRITAQRALHTNLRNNAGTEVGTSGAPLRIDPTGTTTQPISAASLPLPTGAATETTQVANGVLIGAVNETAPASDTASSGLNGRLQRIAQRLTSLIALIPSSVGIAWFSRISDGTDTALVTANGDLKVVDGLRNGGVYGALSIPTANTPVEAKVGASRLTNRKCLQIYSNNNGLFWGLDNTVTTTSGTPIVNGQVLTFSIDPDSTFQIWLVGSTNGKSVQVTECP